MNDVIIESVENRVILGSKTARSNEELVTIYRNNIQQFGFSGRTLLYPSDNFHKAKIKQHCKVLSKLIIKGDSLLDVGCGYGSLVTLLKDYSAECRYCGIDIVPEFIENACENYRQKSVTFKVMDLENYLNQEDWCILLGVVNSVPDPEKLVQLAWKRCRKGLIVDFNDKQKMPKTKYNQFDIKAQKELLHNHGAVEVEEYAEEGFGWTILIAKK